MLTKESKVSYLMGLLPNFLAGKVLLRLLE